MSLSLAPGIPGHGMSRPVAAQPCGPATAKELQSHLVEAARRDEVEMLLRLVEEGADPRADQSAALYWAAENQCHRVMAHLIPLSEPRACCSRALQAAARLGDDYGVSLLLPFSDAGLAMRACLKENHWAAIDALLLHVDRRWQLRARGRAAAAGKRLGQEARLLFAQNLEASLPPVQQRPRSRL